jgi:hypothetical protein
MRRGSPDIPDRATPSPLQILSCDRNRASGEVWITASAQSARGIVQRMEKLTVISPRVAKRHREIIKKASRKLRVSEAQVVRIALEQLNLS